jgi:hypothetical protein
VTEVGFSNLESRTAVPMPIFAASLLGVPSLKASATCASKLGWTLDEFVEVCSLIRSHMGEIERGEPISYYRELSWIFARARRPHGTYTKW